MDFKERLKELRKQRGISQVTLADRVGMSKSTIGAYETGDIKPSVEALETLCDFFNVDMDYMLGKEIGSTYYLDPNVADIVVKLSENDELLTIVRQVVHSSEEEKERFIQMAKLLGIK